VAACKPLILLHFSKPIITKIKKALENPSLKGTILLRLISNIILIHMITLYDGIIRQDFLIYSLPSIIRMARRSLSNLEVCTI
jgi:hypothetical protein